MVTAPQNHVSSGVAASNEDNMVTATPPFPNRPQTDLLTGWESVKLIYHQVSNYDHLDHYLCRALQMIESARQINVKRERIYHQERVEAQALLYRVHDLQEGQKELMSDHTRAIKNQEEMMKINQSLELQLEEAEMNQAAWEQQHCQLVKNADLNKAQVEGLEHVVEQQARDLLVVREDNEKIMSMLLKHYPSLLEDGSNLFSILENESENGRKKRRRPSS